MAEWIALALLSGILGRLGGSSHGNKLYRRAGCSLLVCCATWLLTHAGLQFWWVYGLIFGLSWFAFSTYWDWLFGEDCHAFSGGVVGLAWLPVLFIDTSLWWLVALRTVALAVIWWALNRYRRPVWKWKEDIVEEFLRYFVSL